MTALVIFAVLALAVPFGVLLYLTSVPGRSYSGPLPSLTASETAAVARLKKHIRAIASVPHNVAHYDDLEKAARYIEAELAALGHVPKAQEFTADGRAVRNIEVIIEPRDPARARGSVIVGAHYDSFGDAPGANDNGTGTAATIELARLLADMRGKTDVRVRLVLFVNEEPPYFNTPERGSLRYAHMLKTQQEPIIGMISLETIGCFFEEPNSQQYPRPLGLLYPTTGNFVAFVGLPGSRSFVRAAVQSFRGHTAFPSVGGTAPGFIPGIGWSDHASFEEMAVPALMLTDTAPFRYPHYHRPTDTPDKIDYERLARITAGVERLVRDMVKPEWPIAPVIGR